MLFGWSTNTQRIRNGQPIVRKDQYRTANMLHGTGYASTGYDDCLRRDRIPYEGKIVVAKLPHPYLT